MIPTWFRTRPPRPYLKAYQELDELPEIGSTIKIHYTSFAAFKLDICHIDAEVSVMIEDISFEITPEDKKYSARPIKAIIYCHLVE